MREYGKVYSQFWSSEDIRALSDDGRMLALYLLTCQHGTIAGVFPLPDGYVCEDIAWTQERVSKGFAELLAKGFARRCPVTNWVWISKHLEWNKPENPNQWKAARKFADRVPERCVWRADFMEAFAIASGAKEPLANPSRTVTETLREPVSVTVSVTEGLTLSETPPSQKASRKRKPAATPLPDDFALSPDLREYATAQLPDGDVDALFAKFADQARAKGWTYADWRAAFQTYCRNARKDSGHWSAGQYPRRSLSTGTIHAGVNFS